LDIHGRERREGGTALPGYAYIAFRKTRDVHWGDERADRERLDASYAIAKVLRLAFQRIP